MTPFDIGMISLIVMVLLVLAGLFVPVALMLCSFAGVWAIKGSPDLAVKLMAQAANDSIGSYFFGIVPLFVLMGFIVSETGMGRDAYDVANSFFRRIKGGLGVGTVAANAIFAAITGISIASAAVFTKIAVPEMIRHGYNPRFATGVVAGSSVLGMLIPPSLLLILFAVIAEQSVGDMFLAGVIPGIVLAILFALGIVLAAYIRPDMIGSQAALNAGGEDGGLGLSETLRRGSPIVFLILIVLGGIYSGFFTPIEAGAMGSIAALFLALLRRSLTFKKFGRILVDAGLVTASICMMIIAAQMYSRMLAFSGVPAGIADLTANADLGYWGLMLIYVAVLLLMGMILDSSSILLIMVPIMLPVLGPSGLDPVWFGIVTVLAIEIGLLTPPFGVSVYVIKATLNGSDITLWDIFRGAAPFAAIMMVVVFMLLLWPAMATYLVN
ncbi:TRAP transporter large permease [Cognatishimia maritima]|uniref:TRAP transporter large permease protein n=1 Tax=Cognatishimia maritima TaxID=870908 RepID=A0A1M5RCM5_9RHOB|nr:TRAP transporter large permease [Cognatishimia maritima]SHH24087.1 TRAP transporter, DctM subunit [Cognatishimia maritima]